MMDWLVFLFWDKCPDFRPMGLKLALRCDRRYSEGFKAIYVRMVMNKASRRAWLYLESERPELIFACRTATFTGQLVRSRG